MAKKMRYVGTTGDSNMDVARESGGGSRMEHGKEYSVSKELAEQLLMTADWEEVPTAKQKESKGPTRAQKKAQKRQEGVPPMQTPPPEQGGSETEKGGEG